MRRSNLLTYRSSREWERCLRRKKRNARPIVLRINLNFEDAFSDGFTRQLDQAVNEGLLTEGEAIELIADMILGDLEVVEIQ